MNCEDSIQSTLSRYFAMTKDECSAAAVANGKTAGGCGFDFSGSSTSAPIGCYYNAFVDESNCLASAIA